MVARNFITVPGEQFIAEGTGAVERTVESKLQDLVNVKDFGVTCNGSDDDTVAFCNAMSYCRLNNKTLWLEGTIKIVASSLPAGTNYACALAADSERATLNLQGDVNFLVSQGFSVQNITILTNHTYANSDLTYRYLFASESQRLSDVVVENVRYSQTAVTDGSARGKSFLLFTSGATRFSAINVSIENVREGFVFETNSDAETSSLIDGAFFNMRCSNIQRAIVVNASASNPYGNSGISIDSLWCSNTLTQANNYSGGARTGHSFITGDIGKNAVINNFYSERPIEHSAYFYGQNFSVLGFKGLNPSDISIVGYSTSSTSGGSIEIVSVEMNEAPLLGTTRALVSLRHCENVNINVRHFKGTNTVDGGTGVLIRPSHVVDLSRYAKNVSVTARGQYLIRGVLVYDTSSSLEQAYDGISISDCHILDPTTNQTADFNAALNRYDTNTPPWWTPGDYLLKNVYINNNYFGVTADTAGSAETLELIGRNRVGSSKTKGLVAIDLCDGATLKDNRIDGYYGDVAVGSMYPFVVSDSNDVVIDTTCAGSGPGNTFRTVYYAPNLAAGSRIDVAPGASGSLISADVELVWSESGAANEAALLDSTSMLRLAAGATENDVIYFANFVGIATVSTSDGEYANLAIDPSSINIISSSAGFALTDTASKLCLVPSGSFAAVINNKAVSLDVVVTQKGRYKV